MADLTIVTDRDGADVVVRVGGDLDHDSHGRLERAVDEALDGAPAGLVLDLTAVTSCDSCGLRVLLGAQGQPARALRLTGLDQVLG
jgi:anti-sigma B factor antagonist